MCGCLRLYVAQMRCWNRADTWMYILYVLILYLPRVQTYNRSKIVKYLLYARSIFYQAIQSLVDPLVNLPNNHWLDVLLASMSVLNPPSTPASKPTKTGLKPANAPNGVQRSSRVGTHGARAPYQAYVLGNCASFNILCRVYITHH